MADESEGTVAEGIFSVLILLLLVVIGAYGVKVLSDPGNFGCSYSPAVWAVASFYCTIFGGAIGALYEGYLISIGEVWKVDTIQAIQNTRGATAGYIFSVGLIFDTFMVLGTSKPKLLNILTIFLCTFCPLVAPGLFFGQKIAGAILGALVLVALLAVTIFGCAYGGFKARVALAGSKFLLFGAYYFTPPDASLWSNIIFHILRAICVILVLVSFEASRAESPCWAQEAEGQIDRRVIPAMGVAIIAGWVINYLIA